MAADKITAKAREYLGTPFKHQGRLKSRGVDCAGLVVSVAKDLGLTVFDRLDYGRTPNADKLRMALEINAQPIKISEIAEGDILLLDIGGGDQHLAIVTDIGMIHSYASVGKVVEHRIDDTWKRRITGAYRFKGLT